MGRAEDLCRHMVILRTKIIPHHLTPQEVTITKVIGGFVRTRLVPIPCQSGTDLTSKQALSTLRQLKEKEKKKKKVNETKDGHKAILRLGGAGKEHGGLLIPTKVTMEMYPVLIDQGNLINK